jgi:protein-S-isoprenylcysteine O-methyltransferase Ste14
MYFAGLSFTLNHTQGVELIVVSTTLFQLAKAIRDQKRVKRRADTQGGAVDISATSLVGHIVTPVHALALALPPIIYTGTVTANGLVPPAWIERWRLPFEIGVGEEAWVRTAACAASVGLSVLMKKLLDLLGKQWHYIGVRENHHVVSRGPYGVVRHPMYSIVLAQEAIYTAMFWSYVPLIAFGITAAAFLVKIPIEEKILINHPTIGPDYVLYQQEVRSKLIPYIW